MNLRSNNHEMTASDVLMNRQEARAALGEEEDQEVIGVKVLHNGPDPRNANKNLGKSRKTIPFLTNLKR